MGTNADGALSALQEAALNKISKTTVAGLTVTDGFACWFYE